MGKISSGKILMILKFSAEKLRYLPEVVLKPRSYLNNLIS